MKNTHEIQLKLFILSTILLLTLSAFGQENRGGSGAPEMNELQTAGKLPANSQTLSFSSPLVGEILDPNFGTNGIAKTDVSGGMDIVWGLARQADGKILACVRAFTSDSNSDFALLRYNYNGTLDTTFGTNGKVITNIGGLDSPSGQMAIQPDGKIVVGGYADNRANGAVVRYNADGTLDTTFGVGRTGIVTYPLGSPTNDEGKILLQPDGKIVFIGTRGIAPQVERQYITRLNSDGSFDTNFGTDGFVTTDFGENVARGYDGTILPNGKILVYGWTSNFQLTNAKAAIAKYNADGTLDTTFNTTGKVVTGLDNLSLATYTGFVQPDGKIVMTGRTLAEPEIGIVLRYNADGTLDNTFRGTGIVAINAGNARVATTDALYANGKIVASGWIGSQTPPANFDFLTVRFNLDGTLDSTFGNGGAVITAITPRDDQIFGIMLQPNGQVVAGGYGEIAAETSDAALVRYGLSGITRKRAADFDGDGRADLSVFRPSNNTWYVNKSNGSTSIVQFGLNTDKPAPGDYDGDGATDIAVYREGANGAFYILQSSTNTIRQDNFGISGDVLTAGDWDGDGKADVSVYREGAQSVFFYRGSNNNPNRNITFLPFGTTGDKPLRGDFDGDGLQDAAVFRPSNNTWYIRQSLNNQVRFVQFGLATDRLVPADYDGDAITDIAVYRNGTWIILQSSNNQVRYETFGIAADTPVPADYDGDGKADIAVYRNGTWIILQSGNRNVSFTNFGASGDTAIPNAYVNP